MNKNMKMHTQLTIGFIIIGVLLIISLYTGYTSATQILEADDPARYLSNYATFTAIEFFACAGELRTGSAGTDAAEIFGSEGSEVLLAIQFVYVQRSVEHRHDEQCVFEPIYGVYHYL